MLALVDHSRVRPPTNGSRQTTSPATSPRPQLRIHRLYYPCHLMTNGNGRSQCESTSPLLMPVDLTAESSSVTTLLSANRMLSSGVQQSILSILSSCWFFDFLFVVYVFCQLYTLSILKTMAQLK